jgi:hypothetical protein
MGLLDVLNGMQNGPRGAQAHLSAADANAPTGTPTRSGGLGGRPASSMAAA